MNKLKSTHSLGYAAEIALSNLFNSTHPMTTKFIDQNLIKSLEKRFLPITFHLQNYKFVGSNGARYDFEKINKNNENFLNYSTNFINLKTNYQNYLISPQVIGQTTFKRFNLFLSSFNIQPNSFSQFPFSNNHLSLSDSIKLNIEHNINFILYQYYLHSFSSPIIYFNQLNDILWIIQPNLNSNIHSFNHWHQQQFIFSHLLPNNPKNWNTSTQIKIPFQPFKQSKYQPSGLYTTIGQFQIHYSTNIIKFRWSLNNLIKSYPSCFNIINL